MEVIEMFEVYRFVVRLGIDVPINEDEFTWENMSWKKALEIVLRGKMYGWAQWHIGKITSKMKALEFWKRLREGILIFGHNMHTINDASRFISMLQKDLNDNNLKGVIMKGPVLAEKIYKGIEYVRPFSDIDLLMKPDDGWYFHRYLIESGKYTVP
ncbi:MAG: nucleotidyltransferase family protein, partial [Parabacteroides sp.]|nr:nucleotidyltransferase family protein [Parabacteroides sp.]